MYNKIIIDFGFLWYLEYLRYCGKVLLLILGVRMNGCICCVCYNMIYDLEIYYFVSSYFLIVCY